MMVDTGPVSAITCPNGSGCPHGIDRHRYEPGKQRWVCTDDECWENPYRVIKVYEPFSASMLNAENAARWWTELRADHPEATFEFIEYPHIGVEEHRSWRSRLLQWLRGSE